MSYHVRENDVGTLVCETATKLRDIHVIFPLVIQFSVIIWIKIFIKEVNSQLINTEFP